MTTETTTEQPVSGLARGAIQRMAELAESTDEALRLMREEGLSAEQAAEAVRIAAVAKAAEPPRELPMEGQVLLHVVGMAGDSAGGGDPDEVRLPTEDLDLAMVVSSEMTGRGFGGTSVLHRPVLDLDMPAALVASSTPGHFHLYIDRPMPWGRYVKLLDALAEAGLLEDGYVSAAKARGHTAVRVPWLRKGDPAPSWPEAEAQWRANRVRHAPDEQTVEALAGQFGAEFWDDACATAARERLAELAQRRAEQVTELARSRAVHPW